MAKEKTLKVRGKYQYKTERQRLENRGITITAHGKCDTVVDGYTHYITYKSKD